MLKWIIKNKVVVIVGLVSLIVGALLNRWANSQSEKKIIDALKAEIQNIKSRTRL